MDPPYLWVPHLSRGLLQSSLSLQSGFLQRAKSVPTILAHQQLLLWTGLRFSPDLYIEVLTPAPHNVTIFGGRAFNVR